jgi:hypothetical protein
MLALLLTPIGPTLTVQRGVHRRKPGPENKVRSTENEDVLLVVSCIKRLRRVLSLTFSVKLSDGYMRQVA